MMTARASTVAGIGLAVGLATLLAGWPLAAAAGEYGLDLVRISAGSANGTVSQISPSTTAVFRLGPVTHLYSHQFSGAVFDVAGSAITAASYACLEGGFGAVVGASLCGNFTFGVDYSNDSTLNYGSIPGTRSVGGDDVALGPQQQLGDYAAAVAPRRAAVR